MKCRLCKGEVEERLITYVQKYDDCVVIIENVPAEVCVQCGEKYLRSDIVERIQRLVWENPTPGKKGEVPVYNLAEVA